MRGKGIAVEQPERRKESVHLWVAISVTITLAAYRLSVELIESVRRFFEPYTRLPVAEWFTNTLFFWLLLLLWVAYREWRASLHRVSELQRIVSSISPDVLIVVSPDRTIKSCNNAVTAMFGYEPVDVVGNKTDLLYFDRRVTGQKREVFRSLEKVGFHVGYATGKRRDGTPFPVEIITGLLRGESGAVILMRDITERRLIEEQYVRAKEEAEAANRATSEALSQLVERNYERLKELEEMRDQLTHMIVHDLKSPLSAIGGYLDILKLRTEGRLEPSEAACVAESTLLTRKMSEMILSMLDLHRLEKNEMPLNKKPCDLELLAREALSLVGSQEGGPKMTVEASAGPVLAYGDPDIIRRVMVNLLDNSIKHTPKEGSVVLRMEPGDDVVRVSVKDTGHGIPPEYHKKIFQRFVQVEARKYSTGLGLAFCDLAVKAHGGMIGVESGIGKGTTILFVFPSRRPEAPNS